MFSKKFTRWGGASEDGEPIAAHLAGSHYRILASVFRYFAPKRRKMGLMKKLIGGKDGLMKKLIKGWSADNMKIIDVFRFFSNDVMFIKDVMLEPVDDEKNTFVSKTFSASSQSKDELQEFCLNELPIHFHKHPSFHKIKV